MWRDENECEWDRIRHGLYIDTHSRTHDGSGMSAVRDKSTANIRYACFNGGPESRGSPNSGGWR